MIKILHNKEIDRQVWDNFILQSPQTVIYAQSWYLDIIAPDWKAYMVYNEDLLLAVLPFKEGKKMFFSFNILPAFCQQLGLFTIPNLKCASNIADEIIEQWKQKYWLVSYSFNILNNSELEGINTKFSTNLTHHLDLSSAYQSLYKNYSTNHKRNLKKAFQAGLTVTKVSEIDALITLFKQTKGQEIKEGSEKHYQVLKSLFSAAINKHSAIVLLAKNQEGAILAGGLFLQYNNTIVYLFGASTGEGKKHGAMMLVQDTLIQTYAGSQHILDFEGSNIPSLARFYKGFGAAEKKFYMVRHHRSILITVLKKIYLYVRSR